jgi:hypothetical protein
MPEYYALLTTEDTFVTLFFLWEARSKINENTHFVVQRNWEASAPVAGQ